MSLLVSELNTDYFISNEQLDSTNILSVLSAKKMQQTVQRKVDSDYLKVVEWQDHPEDYMQEVLGFAPWTCIDADDQLDIVHAIRDHKRVSVRSGNGVGKTAVAARIAHWFLNCFYKSIVITTAPTTRQVEKLLWGEMRDAHKNAVVDLGGELLQTELRYEDKWYAIGFSTDEKEKFQGFHAPYILIIVDEASGVSDDICEAIEGILTTENARILLIGNPTDPNSFFGSTHLHPKISAEWVRLHISCYNSPNVRAGKNVIPALCAYDWPEQKRKAWGEYNPFFIVRVIGNFPDTGEDYLVPYHMVHSALERTITPAGNKIFSIDVARFGGDKSVIGRMWGGQFRILKKIFKQDGVYVANKAMEQLKTKGNEDVDEIRVDVIGWGSGCFDDLNRMKRKGTDEEKEMLKNIKLVPVNVSEKPKSKKAKKDYYNLRAQAGFTLRGMFEEGQIDIDNEDLGIQAANIKYEFRNGVYLLEEKDKFKERLGKTMGSPDELDSLLISKVIARGASPRVW